MARIKPQALLTQSKRKKGPSRIGISTVIICILVLTFIALSLIAMNKRWFQREMNHVEAGLSGFEDNTAIFELKHFDLPSYVALNTSKGYITVELFKEDSPEIVDKFLDLCRKGYFEGMNFHRVIKHYVMEAGDPLSLHTEDFILDGKLHDQFSMSMKHGEFVLGTVRPKRGINSGFSLLITDSRITDVDDNIIVFGKVVKGEDVVEEIEEVDTDETYHPKSEIKITEVVLKHRI